MNDSDSNNIQRDSDNIKEEEVRDIKGVSDGHSSMKLLTGKRWLWIFTVVSLIVAVVVVVIFISTPAEEILEPEPDPVELFRRQSPAWHRPGKYWETERLTPNIYPEEKNEVKGIVLHHTAYPGDTETLVNSLCSDKSSVSCHVVIDKDGTRYLLAPPEAVTWHAGYSYWRGRFRANLFMIGIEFQGNTLEAPLTVEQIESAIEYMRPIIEEYNIPRSEVVTHQMIRDAYRAAVPKNKKAWPKVDITPEEYERVLHALDTARVFTSNPRSL